MRRRFTRGHGLGLLVLLAALAWPAAASAHANLVRSEPGASAAVPTAPSAVQLWFSERPDPRYSDIAVYDASTQRYDQGGVQAAPGDPLSLSVKVRALPQGTYTVVWKTTSAVDGHTSEGSFAFAVGDLPPPPPPAGAGGGTTFVPPTPAEVAAKWLMLLAAAWFLGALGLSLLVWAPVLRRADAPDAAPGGAFDRAVARRLLRLADGALLALWVLTLVGLVLQVAKATGQAAWAALAPGALGGYLTGASAGSIWLARLALPPLAALALMPARRVATRPPAGRGATRRASGIPAALALGAGAALGAGYLLTISLTSHAAASPFWVPFTVALDWFHLLATAVWVGGLAGLVATVPLLRDVQRGVRELLLGLVSRFSNVALISVGVLAVTGLYSAWLHVGSFGALLPTAYGLTLVVKVALVAVLLAAGAFNLLWVRPRLAGIAPAGPGEAPGFATVRERFGRAIRLEVALGVAILLAVGVLTQLVPAREALQQARAPQLAQTGRAGDLTVTLTLDSFEPGNNTFDVYLQQGGHPVADAQRVTLRVSAFDMDMGQTDAVTTNKGDGHYTVTGPYLAMSGKWQARVIVRRAGLEDVDTSFTVLMGSAANLARQAATAPAQPPRLPALSGTQWAGLGLIAVAAVLAAVGWPLFRRGALAGAALLVVMPTVLVVGGYMVYANQAPPVLDNEPRNPVPADAASLTSGQALYQANCLSCHGPRGRGDGPLAAAL
ncbi:MAG TPA: copper resistance protein CopC, partial [Thermomicrobiales bacterium]|nr:copper resistance protein CopC [Thermomicrobiales bacterium]